MTGALDDLLARLAHEEGVLVHVESTQGSAPREAGTWMAVWADALTGTIGGGQLEFQATAEARELLAGRAEPDAGVRRYPLGPSLGQCCGGVVFLSMRRVGAADVARLKGELTERLQPVALFGGGHVGAALARLRRGAADLVSDPGIYDATRAMMQETRRQELEAAAQREAELTDSGARGVPAERVGGA